MLFLMVVWYLSTNHRPTCMQAGLWWFHKQPLCISYDNSNMFYSCTFYRYPKKISLQNEFSHHLNFTTSTEYVNLTSNSIECKGSLGACDNILTHYITHNRHIINSYLTRVPYMYVYMYMYVDHANICRAAGINPASHVSGSYSPIVPLRSSSTGGSTKSGNFIYVSVKLTQHLLARNRK